MENKTNVKTKVEKVKIPTYRFLSPEEMPMFAETANHQGTTGNPYPVRATSGVDVNNKEDREWTLITLENDYIRVGILPELGGRVCEAYDKVTGYDFLYRQHVIKPAMIGVYGPWTSGGLEFNWPFHHRPSTLMPLDYTIEECEDGSAIAWLSEHSPSDRTKGMVGIVLQPDTSYFETRAIVTNRTANKHNFLWWENAAVAVHEDYRLVFPPDVTWVHHHNDASHTTFPIADGQYGADNLDSADISWHGTSKLATSYFAGPSKYDFFGGYDYRKECGILHIADHHTSPGKKMFTWGYGMNADTWEKKLTDTDGAYAELMAGSYTDDQPDFTWLAPYESKCFSQFWYPTKGIGYTTYANLDAAVALDRKVSEIRFNVTRIYKSLKATVAYENGGVFFEKTFDAAPSQAYVYKIELPENECVSVMLTDENGETVLSYIEEKADNVHIPENRGEIPTPDKLKTATEIYIAGQHLDQYRSPLYKPDEYYLEALRREPDFLLAYKALGEYYARTCRFKDALMYLEKAWDIESRYNQNSEDGSVLYLIAQCLKNLGRIDEAYDAYRRSAWSYNTISAAMLASAAIDGIRKNYSLMYTHALAAAEKEMRHPLATVYAALAKWKLGDKKTAVELCRRAIKLDPLNQLARYTETVVTGKGVEAFYRSLSACPAETCLDISFDLIDAGFYSETIKLLTGLKKHIKSYAMVHYTLAYCYEIEGNVEKAQKERMLASKNKIVEFFPIRAGEQTVLEAALSKNENDGFAAYLLGCLVYNSRDYERAAALWENAVKNVPDFYIPYRNLALVYFNHLGRSSDALELLLTANEIKPHDSMLLSEIACVMSKLNIGRIDNAEYLEANKPALPTDKMMLSIASAYNSARMFEKAEEVMRSHVFTPAEGEEFITAEAYMYSCLCRGRIAMRDQRYEDALELFRRARNIPENVNVGFWNDSVLMPYKYHEATALKALGRYDEAKTLIDELSKLKDVGMWNMGGEFVYYSAMSVRLKGEEMRAERIMRDAILEWEAELKTGCVYYRGITQLFDCFVGDYTKIRVSELYGMLGYGKLFSGDQTGAAQMFKKSMEINPTYKIAFELEMIGK